MEGASAEACEKSALMRRREGDSPAKINMARNNSRHFLRRWTGEIGFFYSFNVQGNRRSAGFSAERPC